MTSTQLFFSITSVIIVALGLFTPILMLYVNHRFTDLYKYLDLNIKVILDKIEEVEKKINR